MKRILLFSVLLLAGGDFTRAQTKDFTIALSARMELAAIREDWAVNLQRISAEVPDGHIVSDEMNAYRRKIAARWKPTAVQTPSAGLRDEVDSPYVWKGILANTYNFSVPNDNELAVSNSGYLISVMNSTVFMYDLNTDTTIGYLTLSSFAEPLSNLQSKYDPKVIYDPDQNKFIVLFLAGFLDSTSSIIVAFSETDFPGGNWNYYELPGNPLDDQLWSDYPMVALTDQEVFITVNHLLNNAGWINGWQRSVIWQINKADGYAGDSLSTRLHYEVEQDGKRIRNLCPVKGGSHLYGPDVYFLSQKNLAETSDTFFLVHLTDTINAPSQEIVTTLLHSDVAYHFPVNADQPENKGDLITNDSRILGAFYENDRIQLVGNTTDTLTATSAFYHGILSGISGSPSIQLQIISDDSTYYGYPNICYIGNGSMDQTVIINFLHAAEEINPGFSVMAADGQGGYSIIKTVKSGESYHALLSGDERWGDYSGSQRDYTTPGQAWVNGSYATLSHKVNTWCALINLNPPPASVPEQTVNSAAFSLYPNPAADVIRLQLTVPEFTVCAFDLYDLQGRLIRRLMNENVKPGTSLFTFSSQYLASGEYILRATSNGRVVASESFLKQ